jgi:hypothetical protein
MTASLKAKIWHWDFMNTREFQLSSCEVQSQYCSSSELPINMHYCINVTSKILSNWKIMGKDESCLWHWFVFRWVEKSVKNYLYTVLLHSVIITQPLIFQCLSDISNPKYHKNDSWWREWIYHFNERMWWNRQTVYSYDTLMVWQL